MENQVVIEYIQSIISSYKNSCAQRYPELNYRMVWLSPRDVEALKTAIDLVKKLNKIEKIYKKFHCTLTAMAGISEVLKDEWKWNKTESYRTVRRTEKWLSKTS